MEYPVRKPDWSICLYLCPLIWLKTYLKTVLSKILLTQLRSDIGLLFEVIDLSDFLTTAVTLTSFQNDGKHFFLRDKLNSEFTEWTTNSIFSGNYHTVINIIWSRCFMRVQARDNQMSFIPVQVSSIMLLKIQMFIIFIRLHMKNTARTNHYLSGQRIWGITSGIQQKYVIHRRNIL